MTNTTNQARWLGASAAALAAALSSTSHAHADGPLTLNLTSALAAPTPSPAPADKPAPAQPPSPDAAVPAAWVDQFGLGNTGRWYLTIAGGAATNFGSAVDAKFALQASTFLADGLEFGIEAAGWGISQPGRDTGAGSAGLNFRYHPWHAPDWDWSVFGQLSIGVLVSGRAVPAGGTNVNFLPAAGIGFTKRLCNDGARLVIGAGWHHISNAQFRGDDRNPSRDGLMLYVGVQFPL